jgi:hypothetical protein
MKKYSEFIDFLKTIDLASFRDRFVSYKSVEEDLPKNCQILPFIYKYYWDDRNFLSYDNFIRVVVKELEVNLREYNKKRNGYDPEADKAYDLFLKGWTARQYRTWTSIITQIQLGYLFETKYPNQVIMSSELDSQGIDIRIIGHNDFGVKKVTKRRDITISDKEKEGVVPIRYWVPNSDVLKNPKTKNGSYKKPYLDFKNDERIDILSNGFIIFTEKVLNGTEK